MKCGIDLGSRYVKIVCIQDKTVAFTQKYSTIEFYRHYGKLINHELNIDFGKLGLPAEVSPQNITSTGYGRNTLKIHDANMISELKAHTLGACFQTGLTDFTLLDLGGQDSKVIKVRQGKMVDFQTNDKCAASSGRFLENMAHVLDVDLTELSQHYEHPVDISTTCAIFAESELIGKVIEGHPLDQLCAGVNYSIIKRIKPMLQSLMSPILVFTGGVAKNQAIQTLLKQELAIEELIIPPHPQYNGAIGCCFSVDS